MLTKKVALSFLVIAASGAYIWDQPVPAATGDILGTTPQGDASITGSIADPLPLPGDSAVPAADAAPASTAAPVIPAIVNEAPTPPLPKPPEAADSKPGPTAPPALQPAREEAPPAEPEPPKAALAFADRPTPPAPALPAPEVVDIPLPRPRPEHGPTPVHQEPPSRSLVTPASMQVAASGRYADGSYTGPVVDAYYGYVQIQAIVQGGRLIEIKVLRYPNDRRTSIYINRQALPMLRNEVVSAQSASVDIISGATLTSEAFIRSIGGALRQAGA
jgi:uncharacterized protein with FMN-binding domain